jgi:hypothetical protein
VTTPPRKPNGHGYRERRYLDSTYRQTRTYRSAVRRRYRRIARLGED